MQESKQESPRTSDDPQSFGRGACRKRCRDRNRKGSHGLKPECGSTHPCQKMCCFDLWSQTVARHRWSHLHCPCACHAKCSRVTQERIQLIDRPTLFQIDSVYILCCPVRPYMLLSSTLLAQLPPSCFGHQKRPLPKTQTHMLMTEMLPVLIGRQLITTAATHHLNQSI